jgi:peptidoglycan/xylan/chitin deacetylase (PgdA/CDA1 family)
LKAVLTWHSLDESESVISTRPELFARQVDALLDRGVRIVPLATLAAMPGDDDAVALTFDDGFTNFASVAAPLLKSRGVTATVFVVTGLLGRTNTWDTASMSGGFPTLSLMNSSQVREMFDAGFDIGGHGVTHTPLSGLAAELLDDEVNKCAQSIESITGVKPVSFAFPYGSYDERAVEFVAQRFPVACTTTFAALGPGSSAHALPRLDMYYFRREGILDHWGTPLFNGYLMARSAGRRVRSALAGRQ